MVNVSDIFKHIMTDYSSSKNSVSLCSCTILYGIRSSQSRKFNSCASDPRGFLVIELCDFCLCFKFNGQKTPQQSGTRIFSTEHSASYHTKPLNIFTLSLLSITKKKVTLCNFVTKPSPTDPLYIYKPLRQPDNLSLTCSPPTQKKRHHRHHHNGNRNPTRRLLRLRQQLLLHNPAGLNPELHEQPPQLHLRCQLLRRLRLFLPLP